jgi:hypothetical protein
VSRWTAGALSLTGVVALGVAAVAHGGDEQQVFRAATVSVSVNVAVKKGARVVANLTARDFRLTDNGVLQTIDAMSIEAVPIDVTLFLDTSGSTSGRLDGMKHGVQQIIKLLRPVDRFRLLTIGDAVYETVPWVAAGTTVDLSFRPVGGISLVQDALLVGLLHRTEPDRRHLVVGMTDRRDCGSVVSAALLRELSARSEAVLHLIDQTGGGGDSAYRERSCSPRRRGDGPAVLQEVAERTGGELHEQLRSLRSSSLPRAFKSIVDDFRQSYILRYSPTGVPRPGWHAIRVEVPAAKGATIRARQGYYEDDRRP